MDHHGTRRSPDRRLLLAPQPTPSGMTSLDARGEVRSCRYRAHPSPPPASARGCARPPQSAGWIRESPASDSGRRDVSEVCGHSDCLPRKKVFPGSQRRRRVPSATSVPPSEQLPPVAASCFARSRRPVRRKKFCCDGLAASSGTRGGRQLIDDLIPQLRRLPPSGGRVSSRRAQRHAAHDVSGGESRPRSRARRAGPDCDPPFWTGACRR